METKTSTIGSSSHPMETNKYKHRCPAKIVLSNNRYQPYNRTVALSETSPASQEVVNILAKMNHRVGEEGFYVPTPSTMPTVAYFNFDPQTNFYPEPSHNYWHTNNVTRSMSTSPSATRNQSLPPCSPLTPSCAYYKATDPCFTYPEELMPPTSIFTASLARDMMEEETDNGHMDDTNDTQKEPRAYDIASILSLPEQKCEVKTYDFFESVLGFDMVAPQIDYIPYNTQYSTFYGTEPRSRTSTESTVTTTPKATEFTVPTPKSKHKPVKLPNSRQHECEYCGKCFNQRSTLKTHVRIHTGERPYGCQYCGRTFSDNSTYIKHLRTHTKEKPYVCTICSKGFAQSGNLQRHKKSHK